MMKNRLINGLILFTFISIFCNKIQGQDFSKNELTYGIGMGEYDSYRATGLGGLLIVGYQRNLWKDRLRLNPNLTFGYYNTRHYTDVRDQWINSISLETILFFDLIRVKAFSLNIGAGVVVNNTNGLLCTGGEPPFTTNQSLYINELHFGGYLGGGLRINPKKSRISYELMPFNLHFGNNYIEGFGKIGIEVKLK